MAALGTDVGTDIEPLTFVFAMLQYPLLTKYDASKKSQKYMEQVADQNAKVAGAQAIDAERLGQIAEAERRLKTRMQIATQETGFAAQNVDSSTGTALDILGETAMFGEIDIGRIRADAQRKAWGFRSQQHEIQTNKQLGQFQGKTQRTGIVLSTVSSVASAGYSAGWGGGTGNAKTVSGSLKSGTTVGTTNRGGLMAGYV